LMVERSFIVGRVPKTSKGHERVHSFKKIHLL